MFTQQPGRIHSTGCPVHLLKENNEKHHLLPDFRAARSNAIQFKCVECEILANRLGWLGCHCLQHLVARRFPDFNSDCKKAWKHLIDESRPSIIPEKIWGAFPQHPPSKKCPCPRSCCCSMRICSRTFSAQPGIAFPVQIANALFTSPYMDEFPIISSCLENRKSTIPKSKEKSMKSPGSLLVPNILIDTKRGIRGCLSWLCNHLTMLQKKHLGCA